jgi:hypothetical protein
MLAVRKARAIGTRRNALKVTPNAARTNMITAIRHRTLETFFI